MAMVFVITALILKSTGDDSVTPSLMVVLTSALAIVSLVF